MGVPDMSGLGTVIAVGAIAIALLFFTIPPAIFALIAWVCQDTAHALTVWGWAQAVWAAMMGFIIALESLKRWWRNK